MSQMQPKTQVFYRLCELFTRFGERSSPEMLDLYEFLANWRHKVATYVFVGYAGVGYGSVTMFS